MTETIVMLTMAAAIAFGIPGAFVFGRAIGREDEKAELPELRPSAEVRFQPRDGWITRYAVESVTVTHGGPTVVVLQDLVSARMTKENFR